MLNWLFLSNVLPNQWVCMALTVKCWSKCINCFFSRENLFKLRLLPTVLLLFKCGQNLQVFFCQVFETIQERRYNVLIFDLEFFRWANFSFLPFIGRWKLGFASKSWACLFNVFLSDLTSVIFLLTYGRAFWLCSWLRINVLAYAPLIFVYFSIFINFPSIKNIEAKKMVCIAE